jgi:hypothetical protein
MCVCVCVYVCVCVFYFNNFVLQINILTLPLYTLRRLKISQPPSSLQPVIKIIYNFILQKLL